MNKVQIFLLLSIFIVFLLLIESFRRSKNKKYKKQTHQLRNLQTEEQVVLRQRKEPLKVQLEQNIKVHSLSRKNPYGYDSLLKDFPSLKQGFAIFYLNVSSNKSLTGEDLKKLFKRYRLEISPEEGIAQFLTKDRDVLYSLLPNNDTYQFYNKSYTSTSYKSLIYVLNTHKISKYYDLVVCFKYFIKVLHEMNIQLAGVLLSERHKIFTKSNELDFLSHVKKYYTLHKPQ